MEEFFVELAESRILRRSAWCLDLDGLAHAKLDPDKFERYCPSR